MSRKNGTEVSFQEKFKDRMESIGKEGISSIMRNMENPINQNNNNLIENKSNNYNQASRSNKKQEDAYSHISSVSSKKIIKKDSPTNKSTQQSISSRYTNNSILSSGAQAILSSRASHLNSILNPLQNNQINVNNNPFSIPNLNFLNNNNNKNNYNINQNFLPNGYNMYNNQNSNINYNYGQNGLNNNGSSIHNNFNNDQQGLYNPYQYQYLQATPLSNLNRNYLGNNSYGSNTPNTNFDKNLNFNNYNNFNPVLNNIGYQNLGPTMNYPIPITPNQIDQMRNNGVYNQVKPLSGIENANKRDFDKMRSMSSNYKGDMSAINENNKNENSLNSYVVQNTSSSNFNKKRGNSIGGTMVNGVYKPYNLEDYKKIANVKIELGSLGPNIGTKEWEERQEKMKKMEEYSNKVKENKMIFKLKKETPIELVEKEKNVKKENSNRNKAYKYDSLVREKITKMNSNLNNIINHNYEFNDEHRDVSGILNKYNNDNQDLKNNFREFNDNSNDKFISENYDEKPLNKNKSLGRGRNTKSIMSNQDIKDENNDYGNREENSAENNYNYFRKNVNNNLFSNKENNNGEIDYVVKKNALNINKDNSEFYNNNLNKNYDNFDFNGEVNLNINEFDANQDNEIEKIQKQRNALTSKINEIKESFL